MEIDIFRWLLDGDVSIQYQVYRDLLGEDRNDLQRRIANEGWGKDFLEKRLPNGHWGYRYYQPKWTSSHYTLLDLRNLCLPADNVLVYKTLDLILENERAADGGIHPKGTTKKSDVCINGMMLNVCSWFKIEEERLKEVIDFILSQKMPDGGYNCQLNRSGAKHSSVHSTISVLEGFSEYKKQGYRYRMEDVRESEVRAREFLLVHKLFKSDMTGKIIHPKFLKTPYPPRWYYDTLRALDYFAHSGMAYDLRMQDAIDVLLSKRTKEGLWKVQAAHPGEVHFVMEKAGGVSRWNTLRAVRALKGLGLEP